MSEKWSGEHLGSRGDWHLLSIYDMPVAMLLLGGTPQIYQKSPSFQDSSPPTPNNCSNTEQDSQVGRHAGTQLHASSFLYYHFSTLQSSCKQSLGDRRKVILCASNIRPTKYIPHLLPQFGFKKLSDWSKITDSGLGNTVLPVHLRDFPLQGLSEALTSLHTNYKEPWTRRPLPNPDP